MDPMHYQTAWLIPVGGWGMYIIPDGLKVDPADVKCLQAFGKANFVVWQV